jgi:hypothetical protein
MKFATVAERPPEEKLPVQLPVNQPPTMLAYLQAAQDGADLERLEKLMELHERWEAGQARRAFDQAMADFRSESMVIIKSKHVDIAGGAKFNHAQLADVCAAVIPNLSKYGLRHKWEYAQENNKITVSCVISHRLGHCEKTTLFGPPDKGGNKSDIHAVASTVALLERYTLLGATGLAAREMDNNPQGTGIQDPAEPKFAKPDGYDRWRADTQALADEGKERLQPHWQKSSQEFRDYASTADKSWWADCKAKAAKASKAMQS